MNEIQALREIRPVPTSAELEALHRAARDRFVAGAARRRWRLPVLAGGLTAVAAGTAALALTLTSGPAAPPGQQTAAGHSRTVVTTAWTVREDADGAITIDLRQYADPAGLQQTLRADGVNAIVRQIPVTFRSLGIPRATVPSKPGLRVPRPSCRYAATNNAPPAVQGAVVTLPPVMELPTGFVIHPEAMPPGSALLLPFLAGMPRSPKNGGTGVTALIPRVLNSDAVPACVAITKPVPSFAPTAKGSL
jgi:hypothetical protein